MELTSQVIISTQLEQTLLKLEALRKNEKIIEIYAKSIANKLTLPKEDEQADPYIQKITGEKESFTLKEAKVVVEKAYLASEEITVIILVADQFSVEVQNSLLKVIEEPPKNKIFIFLTQSKSAILPTIKSRLPIHILSEEKSVVELGLDLEHLNLEAVYDFSQTHKFTKEKEMKILIEEISKAAIASEQYDLDEKTLILFSNAFRALDVGSPVVFVLNTLLLKLLARKKRS